MASGEKMSSGGTGRKKWCVSAAFLVVCVCAAGVTIYVSSRRGRDRGVEEEPKRISAVPAQGAGQVNLRTGGLGKDLLIMVRNGRTRDVRALLRAGADPNTVEGTKTPLIAASERNYSTIVDILLETGAEVDLQTPWGNVTALQAAAQKGNTAILRKLLDAGADPTIKDNKGMTALHHASSAGSVVDVAALIGKGGNISSIGNGKTPLHYAAWGGNPDIAELLLKEGSVVDPESVPDQNTPLALATWRNQGAVMKVLLDANAEINHQNVGKFTALHWAAHYGHIKAIEILVERGADKTILDEKSRNPKDALCTCTAKATDVLFCQFRPCKTPEKMMEILTP